MFAISPSTTQQIIATTTRMLTIYQLLVQMQVRVQVRVRVRMLVVLLPLLLPLGVVTVRLLVRQRPQEQGPWVQELGS